MGDGFPRFQTAQGVEISWGSTNITATSISYSMSAAGEVDVTSMDSTIYTDPNNTSNKRIVKEVEYGMIDPGEVQVEFIGPSTFDQSFIGQKNSLRITNLGSSDSADAYLTNLSIQAKAGELVTGSCTFRLA
jgi:hypothetical protein